MKIIPDFYKKSDLSQKLIYLFIFIMGLSLSALLINLIINPKDVFYRITVFYSHSFGSDFEYIYNISKTPTPYNETIYPPFAHLLMKCIGFVFTSWVSYAIFHVGALILCCVYLYKLINQKTLIKVLLLICIIVSLPFLFTIERGNIIVWAFLFTVLFLYYYKSESVKNNRLQREFSYVFLAMAAAIKLYPLIFIVFLVMDKNLRGTVKTLLYTVILLTVPFLFFEGGFNNLGLFLSNMFNHTGADYATYNKVNILSLFYIFIQLTDIGNIQLYEIFTQVAFYLSIFYLLTACFATLFIKEKYKVLAVFGALILLIPQVSYLYGMLFLIPALIAFFNENKKTKKDVVILICYMLLFLSFPFPIIKLYWYIPIPHDCWNSLLTNTPFQILALLTISMIYIIEGLFNMVNLIRQKKFFIKLFRLLTFKRDCGDMDLSNGIMGQAVTESPNEIEAQAS